MSNINDTKIIQGDCLEVLPTIPSASVDLILTDPPYYRVKGIDWDRQWATPEAFLEWIGKVADEWARVLKPNGSLYCFASSKMHGRVELELAQRFNVLNSITWQKPSGGHCRAHKEGLRSYFAASERILFCEHLGAERLQSSANYALISEVFAPLRTYLAQGCEGAGWTVNALNKAWRARFGTNGGMAGHWLKPSQWSLPNSSGYAWLREVVGEAALPRTYEEIRADYEALKVEYTARCDKSTRRFFKVSSAVPYTDVWTYQPVQYRPGKHPCEKPLSMLQHIIEASSRPGDVVLDSFMGSGATGVAALELGRSFIGIELDGDWHRYALNRLSKAKSQEINHWRASATKQGIQLSMFDEQPPE